VNRRKFLQGAAALALIPAAAIKERCFDYFQWWSGYNTFTGEIINKTIITKAVYEFVEGPMVCEGFANLDPIRDVVSYIQDNEVKCEITGLELLQYQGEELEQLIQTRISEANTERSASASNS